MWLRTIILILCVTASFASYANLQAYFDFKSFLIPGEGPYVETQLSFTGESLAYITLPNGNVQAEVATTIIISRNDSVIDFRKFNILSPELTDSTIGDFIDLRRFPLKNGTYKIELELLDLNAPNAKKQILEQEFVLYFAPDQVVISDITLLKAYAKAETPTELTKSGYDLFPYVSDYFPSDVDVLAFYAEVYQAEASFGEDGMYLIASFISKKDSDEPIAEMLKMDRQKVELVTPMLHVFDISQLPSGTYQLNIDVRNKNNEPVYRRIQVFYRNNFLAPTGPENLEDLAIENTFAARYTHRDSLLEHLNSCMPIASNVERTTIEHQMETAELLLLQRYFYQFWLRRNDQNPQLEWEEYLKQVEIVNKNFGTRIKEGYQTDQGRVFLQYGPPNTRVQRHHPTETLPFEIWHYYHIGAFNNKRFLFYTPNVAAVEFILLHSDMLGETQNNDWPTIMRTKNPELRPSDSGSNRSNPRDSFSGDSLEDLFYNPR
jgi:GWxTD domain-containing protein